jgi:sugar phosphate permease
MFVVLGLGSMLWLFPWLSLVKNDDRSLERASIKTGAAPAPLAKVIANPVIWGVVVGTFCYQYFVYFCMTWMPAYFAEHRGLSLQDTGVYTMYSFLGIAAVAVLAGWAADRLIDRGLDPINVRKAFVVAGFVLGSTELFGAVAESNSAALFWAIFSLSGLGLTTANYWALTQTILPGAAVGRVVGIQNCAASLSGIAASLITGWLKQATGSYQAPMQTIWIFLLLGIASYLFVVRRKYAP